MRRAATALSFVLSVLASAGAARAAEPTLEPPELEPRTTIVSAGPDRLLLATGAATFAFAYGGSLWVGAMTTRSSDRALLIPFAGPWVALGARGTCGESGVPCGQQSTYAGLLITDGLVQAASAVQIALAFLHRELRQKPDPVIRTARVTLAPSRPSGGGLALAAVGQF
jgi:hypothetical protein